jgi:hypothetical protein
MHRHLSRWASHIAGILKKEKLRLLAIIDELEALVEVRLLSSDEIELKIQWNAYITSLLWEEELNGINAQRLNSYWKGIQILDISML